MALLIEVEIEPEGGPGRPVPIAAARAGMPEARAAPEAPIAAGFMSDTTDPRAPELPDEARSAGRASPIACDKADIELVEPAPVLAMAAPPGKKAPRYILLRAAIPAARFEFDCPLMVVLDNEVHLPLKQTWKKPQSLKSGELKVKLAAPVELVLQ